MLRIKNLAKLISKGTTPSTIGGDFVETGIQFLKAENIQSGRVSSEPEFYISDEIHRALLRSNLQARDVLVVIAGATVGKSAVLQADLLPANTNQAVAFVRCENSGNASFVDLWLSTDRMQEAIKQMSVQSAQPNLSMEDLGNLPIVVPPDEERRAICQFIAEQIGSLDALAFEAEAALTLLYERRGALITAAVTGKIDVRGRISAEAA